MKKNSSSIIAVIVIIVIIVVVVALGKTVFPTNDSATSSTENTNALASSTEGQSVPISDSEYQKIDITAPKGVIHAFSADTESKKELGLSGRDSVAGDGGMIFEFDSPGIYEFWMKDMKFPLDIVWIGEDKAVKTVSERLTPDSYPNTFTSTEPVKYVLEINAGAAAKFGIATGTVLQF